jgi:tetratricopeptide (TPR) repeat protein
VGYFQDGEYQKAIDSLRALLEKGANRQTEIEACKYLGFSCVMLQQIEAAKQYFRSALEKKSDLELDTLEVPPNILIVFRQVKLEKQMAEMPAGIDLKARRRTSWGVFLLVAGISCAGGGAYFAYDSYHQYSLYKDVDRPNQKALDTYYSNHVRSFIVGGGLGGVTVITVPISVALLAKRKHAARSKAVSLLVGPHSARLAVGF